MGRLSEEKIRWYGCLQCGKLHVSVVSPDKHKSLEEEQKFFLSREVGDIRRLLKFDFVYNCICATNVLNIQMVHSYPVGCRIYGMKTKREN